MVKGDPPPVKMPAAEPESRCHRSFEGVKSGAAFKDVPRGLSAMNCPACGADVVMEEFDLVSGTCRQCADRRLGRTRKVYPPVVRWAGRIGHVLLFAIVCAPFGVLALGIVGFIGLWVLSPILVPIAIVLNPIDALFALVGLPFTGGFDPVDHEGDDHLRLEAWSQAWKAFPVFLLAVGILAVCYALDQWRGVLIGAALLGALIGAALSIHAQVTARTRPSRPSP
jgi:hypothetical protein